MVTAVSTSPNSTQEGIQHLKLTTKREELVSKLSIVSRAVSNRAATQSLSGILLSAPARAGDAARHRPRDGAGDRARGRGRRRGRRFSFPAGCSPRSLARSAMRRWKSRRARPSVTWRSAAAAPAFTSAPCRPRTSRAFPSDGRRAAEDPGRRRWPRPSSVVARAASRDDMRPVLTGVLVSAAGNEMTMVATDSYRLAVKRTELEAEIGGELEANIPARALRELGADPLRGGGRRGLGDAAAPTRRCSRQGRSSSTRG